MPNGPLTQIRHIVVLMLENRSFDNMLGWLYDPANPAPFNQPPSSGSFEGVWGKNLSNPRKSGASVSVGKGADPTAPNPDPGEPYQDVYSQVFGLDTILAPNQVPPDPPIPCNMQGFVYDYEFKCQGTQIDPGIIMNCFTQATVPVIWSLAFYYGVCDHWFASIPTQTLCNRSFLHAGTSSGYVNNEGGDGVLFVNETPTIFNVMQNEHRDWRIYTASWEITSLALLTQRQLWDDGLSSRFSNIRDFFAAAKKPGALPEYSFIEPIYMDSVIYGAENDMHPEAKPYQFYGLSNVDQGERLLYSVYNAVRNSPDWNSTLLLILFDEHGGCYDHVCPPAAIPPDNVVISPTQPGGTGFKFDRLGIRVPAIVVSPYTAPRTVVNTVFDHTSALATIVNGLGLTTGRLGARQAAAADVGEALNLDAPRQDFPPIPAPPNWDPSFGTRVDTATMALLHAHSKPLTDLQKQILVGAARRLNRPVQEVTGLASSVEASTYLIERGLEWERKKL